MIEESDEKSNKKLNKESIKKSNEKLTKKMFEVLNKYDDSAIMCDEVIESYDEGTKTALTNFSERI